MAIPWTQLDHTDAACIYQNLANLMATGKCPLGEAASAAWSRVQQANGHPDALRRWVEQYVTYNQWQLLYAHCASSAGKNGQRLNSLANAGKNKGLLT